MTLLRLRAVIRGAGDEVEELKFASGVNTIVGLKDTGKTSWLRFVSFVLGDTNTPEKTLGSVLAAKYDWAAVVVTFDNGDEVRLERRWKVFGAKHSVLIDGSEISSRDFSDWVGLRLGLPEISFPRGNPYSGATWPQLTWRMLFRHVYREERSWNDIAEKQPTREQQACILQLLGVAEKAFPKEAADEVRLANALVRATTRREHFSELVSEASRGLLADTTLKHPTAGDIGRAVEQLRDEVRNCEAARQTEVGRARGAPARGVAELADERAGLSRELQELRSQAAAAEQRQTSLSGYHTSVKGEVERLRRARVASGIFEPISVRTCPHCDQRIERKPDGTTCFVCCQALPPVAGGLSGGLSRLDFEEQQLHGEDGELADLISSIGDELDRLRHSIRQAEESLRVVDATLRPAHDAATTLLSPEVLRLTSKIGQLEERIAQLVRFQETTQRSNGLATEISELEHALEERTSAASGRRDQVSLPEQSERLSAGINEYLALLNEGDPTRWVHGEVALRLDTGEPQLTIGGGAASSIGATSMVLVLLGYQYALLRLSVDSIAKFPGVVLIDFPPTLADGSTVADKENYLLEPFVALCTHEEGLQVIACGRAFDGLEGADRLTLTEVWQNPGVESTSGERQYPGPSQGLPLTVGVHFHTRQTQIMMVLDQENTRRLAVAIPALDEQIQKSATWPGAEVLVKWGGGEFVAKLVHHIDNGNVKFTVRKRATPALWQYLDRTLRELHHLRYSAMYFAGVEGELAVFRVNVSVPPSDG